MKFVIPVTTTLLSPLSLRRSADMLKAVQTYAECLPIALPEQWGWSEPDRPFDLRDMEQTIASAGECDSIYWKRKRAPKAEGSFTVRWRSKSQYLRDTHGKISFTSELGQISQAELINWLKTAGPRTQVHMGMIDAVTKPYLPFAQESGASPYGDNFLFTTHLLRHWLPDVFWGTVFGQPYVKLFGKERLLNAPVAVAEEIAENMVYLQLTDNLADLINDFDAVQACRTQVKKHLQVDAFFESARGYDRSERGPVGDVFATPDFQLIQDA